MHHQTLTSTTSLPLLLLLIAHVFDNAHTICSSKISAAAAAAAPPLLPVPQAHSLVRRSGTRLGCASLPHRAPCLSAARSSAPLARVWRSAARRGASMSSGKAFDPAPSIRVRDSSPNHHHSQAQQQQHQPPHEPAASSAVAPMPITSKSQDSPPPPLPPPRYIEGLGEGHDSAWHFANRSEDSAVGSLNSSSSIKPGSSLLGGHIARPGASYTGEQRSVDFGDATADSRSQPSSPRSKDLPSSERDRVPDLNALLEFK